MTAVDIKATINEIVTEIHSWNDFVIARVSDNMVNVDGYPQLYITKIDRDFTPYKSIKGIWVRVGNTEDYTEDKYWKCRCKDSELKEAGYDTITVKGAREAIFKLNFLLNEPEYPRPGITKVNNEWNLYEVMEGSHE